MALAGYLTIDEAATWLRIPSTDSSQDDEILAAIAAATGIIAGHLGWDPLSQEVTETMFGGGGTFLFPKRRNITAVASCVDAQGASIPCGFDAQAISRTDGQWFGRDANYTVTYTAGYAAGSLEFAPVKAACKQAVAAIYNSHAYDPNLNGEQMQGVFMGMYSQEGLGALPRGARAMIEHLKRRY